MRLRNQGKEEQLLFDPDINKTLRQLRQRRKREQKNRAEEWSCGAIMAEEPNDRHDPPPRRVLGDYAFQQGPKHFSSIAVPNTARAIIMQPAYMTLISNTQFMGLDHEDPYTHLSTFYELTATMGIKERDKEAAYLKLFQFSLAGKAKDWLNSHPNQSLRRWSEVEEKFLQKFFPLPRLIKARSDISNFRQGADEAFCAAWDRFKTMLRKCPNHGFEEIAQLNIFHNGLRPETKMILDAAAGGTMMAVDVEHASRIIDALASTDYQAQHDRSSGQKKGMLELNTHDAILAQKNLLTQQVEALTKQMAKLPHSCRLLKLHCQ